MFGWFGPHCPVNVREKVWTEQRMAWLADQFGVRRLREAEVILPTATFFPDPYDASEDAIRTVFDRLCGYLRVDPGKLDLAFFDDTPAHQQAGIVEGRSHGPVGMYEGGDGRAVIHVGWSQTENVEALLGTLAHEVSHWILLGGGMLTGEEEDYEWVTDLLPVFLGLGVFAANTVVQERHDQDGLRYAWRISKSGYLPARVYGYAFALFALQRDEAKPSWAQYLRLDVRTALKQGLDYVRRTDDTLFHPSQPREPSAKQNVATLVGSLSEASAGSCLAALGELRRRGSSAAGSRDAVESVFRKAKEPILRAEAALTFAAIHPDPTTAAAVLVDGLTDRDAEARRLAATALGTLAASATQVVPALTVCLRDNADSVVQAAADALSAYGAAAAPAAPVLALVLRNALVHSNGSLCDAAARALRTAVEDPAQVIRGAWEEQFDAELFKLARQAIAQVSDAPAGRPSVTTTVPTQIIHPPHFMG